MAKPQMLATGKPLLEIIDVSMAFGGLLALNRVKAQVWPGQIKGIIGPNGAGKTTLFNIITGIYQPTGGDVRFDGRSIINLKPSTITGLGIARTFQNIRLFDNMTVLENVMVGQHVQTKTGFLSAALRLPKARREETLMAERGMALLETVGLAHRATEPATSLPFGRQRTLEIARALATRPKLLFLDEPAAGLNLAERQDLSEVIRRIRARGITVVLVEHDMELVMGLVDEVLVLEYGIPIADGPPQEVQNDPRVIAAYLGEEAL